MLKLLPRVPDTPTTRHVDERFDLLHDAVAAAAKKAEEAAAAAAAVRSELGSKIDGVAANVAKLASARLMQQAFTSLVLAGGLTVLIHAFSG
jgi:hypothetical protein